MSAAGFLHKMDDFVFAADLAVKTDRTLVDFSPGLRAGLMRNKYNQQVPNFSTQYKYFHGWTWANILNTSQMVYEVTFQNVSCYSTHL